MDDEKLKTCETLFSICNSFGLRVLVERNIGMYIINYFKDKDRWCKTSIKVFNPCNYHHIRTKGSHPELRLVESNIVKICVDCHLKEHGFKPRIKLQ